jgi:hypothetical protein
LQSALEERKGGKKHDDDDDGDSIPPEMRAAIEEALELLMVANEVLVIIQIEDAENTPVVDPENQDEFDEHLAKAREELVKAYAYWASGDFDKAADRFRKAWEEALKAQETALEAPDEPTTATASHESSDDDDDNDDDNDKRKGGKKGK